MLPMKCMKINWSYSIWSTGYGNCQLFLWEKRDFSSDFHHNRAHEKTWLISYVEKEFIVNNIKVLTFKYYAHIFNLVTFIFKSD